MNEDKVSLAGRRADVLALVSLLLDAAQGTGKPLAITLTPHHENGRDHDERYQYEWWVEWIPEDADAVMDTSLPPDANDPSCVYVVCYGHKGIEPLAVRITLEAAQRYAVGHLHPRREGEDEILRWRKGAPAEWTYDGRATCRAVWEPNRQARDGYGWIHILAFAVDDGSCALETTQAGAVHD